MNWKDFDKKMDEVFDGLMENGTFLIGFIVLLGLTCIKYLIVG